MAGASEGEMKPGSVEPDPSGMPLVAALGLLLSSALSSGQAWERYHIVLCNLHPGVWMRKTLGVRGQAPGGKKRRCRSPELLMSGARGR